MRQLEGEYRESVLATLASLGQGLPPGVDPLDIALDLTGEDSSNGGSDSSDSDGPPVHMQWRGQYVPYTRTVPVHVLYSHAFSLWNRIFNV